MKFAPSITAFLCAAMLMGHAAAHPPSRPLKVVVFSKGAYSLMSSSPLEYLKGLYAMCSLAPGKSPAPFPKTLTEDYLLKNFGRTDTSLWQGNAQANFVMDRVFSVDIDKNCEVVQHTAYRADVSIDCVSHWTGASDGDDALKIVVVDSGKDACLNKGESEAGMKKNIAKSTLKTLGNGFQCLYHEGVSFGGVSLCLYPKTPYYMDNPGRPVRFSDGVIQGNNGAGFKSSIKEIVDGDLILLPDQFTKSAINAWIKQPSKVFVQ